MSAAAVLVVVVFVPAVLVDASCRGEIVVVVFFLFFLFVAFEHWWWISLQLSAKTVVVKKEEDQQQLHLKNNLMAIWELMIFHCQKAQLEVQEKIQDELFYHHAGFVSHYLSDFLHIKLFPYYCVYNLWRLEALPVLKM